MVNSKRETEIKTERERWREAAGGQEGERGRHHIQKPVTLSSASFANIINDTGP